MAESISYAWAEYGWIGILFALSCAAFFNFANRITNELARRRWVVAVGTFVSLILVLITGFYLFSGIERRDEASNEKTGQVENASTTTQDEQTPASSAADSTPGKKTQGRVPPVTTLPERSNPPFSTAPPPRPVLLVYLGEANERTTGTYFSADAPAHALFGASNPEGARLSISDVADRTVSGVELSGLGVILYKCPDDMLRVSPKSAGSSCAQVTAPQSKIFVRGEPEQFDAGARRVEVWLKSGE